MLVPLSTQFSSHPTPSYSPVHSSGSCKVTAAQFMCPAWTALLSSRHLRLLPNGQSQQGFSRHLLPSRPDSSSSAHLPPGSPILVSDNTIDPGAKPKTSLSPPIHLVKSPVRSTFLTIPLFISVPIITTPVEFFTISPLSYCQILLNVLLPQVFSSALLLKGLCETCLWLRDSPLFRVPISYQIP